MRGSEGGGVSRPDGQKTVWTTFFSPKLFYSFQMGSNIFQDGGGGGGGGAGATSSRGGSKCFL